MHKNPGNIKKIIDGVIYYSCNKCGEWLSGDRFCKDKYSLARDMHASKCKKCRAEDDHRAKKYKSFNRKPIDGKIHCKTCDKYLDPDSFWNSINNKHRLFRINRCKECSKICVKNSFDSRSKDKMVLAVLQKRMYGINRRTSKKGFECNINCEYLCKMYYEQDGLCAISGVDMDIDLYSGRNKNSLSIDRIDSNVGYVIGNIQLVCDFANRMKLDYSNENL